ncbi:MAG: FtsX-like permease family protein [Acidobacteriaceae bacterium]|nr:FtsX-like permease family protein [Acidobacteriaceae bacterium]MBV9501877.1 FtsX-like permease family protein [Acidobacteriaceae bacterium]
MSKLRKRHTGTWLSLLLVGRLQPGVAQERAIAQLTPAFQRAIYTGIKKTDPKEPKPRLYFTSARGIEDFRADFQRPLTFLMGMVLVVLIIACSNVAMMLIARNVNRRREFGIRMSLGASRMQIFRQLLIEGVLLAGIGAIAGWLFSSWATEVLTAWSGLDVVVRPDRNVLAFTLTIALLAALTFGLTPIRTATTVPMSMAMKASAATSNTDWTQYLGRKLVIVGQILLCFVLLVAAGLLAGTLRNLESRNLGMRTDGLLMFGLNPQKDIHSDADAIRFHKAVLDRIRTLPGVESATVVQNRVGGGISNNNGTLVDGRNPLPNERFAQMRDNEVGAGFLHVLGIPLLVGRDIAESDTASSEKIVVVNETYAEQYLKGTNPLGHHVAFLSDRNAQYTIVGVTRNSRYTGIRERDQPMAFFPFTQVAGVLEMDYEVHTFRDPQALIPVIARIVRALDSNAPMEKPITQRAQFEESVSQERLTANLSTFFGLLSALLAAIGLYGTLAYNVSRRTVEIGVRMAVGAQRSEILRMILRDSLWIVAIGLGLGIPVAVLVARALRSMLFGLSPLDPMAFCLALMGITTIALAASYIPARYAASVDPLKSLRAE